MRWLRFEMKGMVDVKFIFIDKRKEEYYAGCFYFLYTKTCVNYLQLRQAKKWSLTSLNSSIYSGTLPWPPCLVWILILQARFRKVLVLFFIFYFFLTFKDVKVAMKNEDYGHDWKLISMTNSRTEHEMSFILHFFFYYIFLGVYFDNSVLASAFYITF